MELPQPRPFRTESRKPTHDFLSLYSPVQQDPRPPSQGGFLKTHDFLQPLEQVEKHIAKEKNKVVVTEVGKPPPVSVEHILPGGIGTYSISHISNYINQRVPKPERGMFIVAQASSSERNDENSNCSSYTGSGFTLWEESAAKKGQTGKENIIEDNSNVIEDGAGVTIGGGGGQWPPSVDRPSLSSSNHNPHTPILRPLSSSAHQKKNQSFIDMIKSACKTAQDADDYDDDDEDFVVKKEPPSSHSHLNGNLSVKVDGKRTDQKPNTPRSKHSATEQRRRSKINDRFHMLRELIPHGDQKRDKASFLLEVIEYIQFLQEKVHKYEDSYPGWNHEPPKLMSWGKNHGMPEDFVDLSQVSNCGPGSAVMFGAKFDENKISVSPTIPRNGHNLVESGMNGLDSFKETDKASSIPVLLQPKIFSSGGSSSAAVAVPPRLASDTENRASQPQSQPWQSRSCTTECTPPGGDAHKDEALTIESGTISISSVYSQGLLNTLTQALQSSGVDLSQATISVQIDLGKRANSNLNSSTSIVKDDVPSSNQTVARSRLASTGDESDQALKRQKTGRS